MSFVVNVCSVPDMNFQGKPSSGSQDIAKEGYCTSCKVPGINDWLQPNLTLFLAKVCSVGSMKFQENLYNRSWDRTEKAHSFLSKVPFIIHCSH